MSPPAELTSVQLKGIMEGRMDTKQSAREVQKQVENGKEVLNPENTSLVLNTFRNTIDNRFEHNWLDHVASLLNAHPISQSTDDHVPGYKCSIPGPPRSKFLAHQVMAI